MNTPMTWIAAMLLVAAYLVTRLGLDGTTRNVIGAGLAIAAFALGATAFARGRGRDDG
ncbi:hypothetical protein [Actinomadura sp. WMMB 499]|uniref:hypothetical protein n=1 Tax=Actinomadura sp. WMMB 499 TaxID=1219491 RepID=UPI00159DD325|nr:hypothetical protein [Actinomadura sp. WMMB 499]